MFKKLKNKKGFTLIEIIVVIVILAVLMAVAVPSVMSYMNEGKNAKYQTIARAVLINAQTEYAKAVANGETNINNAKTTVKNNVEKKVVVSKEGEKEVSKVVAKHDYNGADEVTIDSTDDITLTDGSDLAERDVAQVICKIKIGSDTKKVTIDTNKKVTVENVQQ